jgi:hypothetical protein
VEQWEVGIIKLNLMGEIGVPTINLVGIWHNTKIKHSEEPNVESNDENEKEEIEKVMKAPEAEVQFLESWNQEST